MVEVKNYTIRGEIGKGAFSVVYLGEHNELRYKMAIKVPTDAEYAELIRREGVITSSLEHQNIVKVHDLCLEEDNLYILMGYVDGQNLEERMKAGRLGEREADSILKQTGRALEHAHLKGVIHRDLKPSNILIGKDGVVKVADFGLGKIVQELSSVRHSLDEYPEGFAGTLQYMAPELLAGGEATVQSDIYSFGIVMHLINDKLKNAN